MGVKVNNGSYCVQTIIKKIVDFSCDEKNLIA